MSKLVKLKLDVCLYDKKFIFFGFHHPKLLHLLLLDASFQLLTSKRKIKQVIYFVWKGELRYRDDLFQAKVKEHIVF